MTWCVFVLYQLRRWAAWRHRSQSNSAVQQVTFISHVLGLFVPVCMEVWEDSFEKRGSKCVLNVARLFDVVHWFFPGPRKNFLPWLWSCFMISYWRCTLWPLHEVSQPLVPHSVQSPGEFRGSWYICVAELRDGQGNSWGLEAIKMC